MNMEEIVVRGQRAAAAGHEDDLRIAMEDLLAWMSTQDGEVFLRSVLSPPTPARRGIFCRSRSPVVLPVSRVAVPATAEPLGELRSFLVGVDETSLSVREASLVDGEMLEWAEWDPMRRTLTTGDGVGVVVPDHVTIAQAAMGLLSCQMAMWPEVYLPETDAEEDEE